MSRTFRLVSAAAIVLGGISNPAAGETPISGVIEDEVIEDDAVVLAGDECTLRRTLIIGSVRVETDAVLFAEGASIVGGIYGDDALAVAVTHDFTGAGDASFIVEDIALSGPTTLLFGSSTIVGDVVLTNPGGNSSAAAAAVFVGPVGGPDTIIGGFKLTGHEGDNVTITQTFVAGDVKCTGSTNPLGIGIIANDISGDVKFNGNRSEGEVSGEIVGNEILGDLKAAGNSPPPEVADNIVHGKTQVQ